MTVLSAELPELKELLYSASIGGNTKTCQIKQIICFKELLDCRRMATVDTNQLILIVISVFIFYYYLLDKSTKYTLILITIEDMMVTVFKVLN